MSGQQARRRSRRVEGSLIEIFVGSEQDSEFLAEGFLQLVLTRRARSLGDCRAVSKESGNARGRMRRNETMLDMDDKGCRRDGKSWAPGRDDGSRSAELHK